MKALGGVSAHVALLLLLGLIQGRQAESAELELVLEGHAEDGALIYVLNAHGVVPADCVRFTLTYDASQLVLANVSFLDGLANGGTYGASGSSTSVGSLTVDLPYRNVALEGEASARVGTFAFEPLTGEVDDPVAVLHATCHSDEVEASRRALAVQDRPPPDPNKLFAPQPSPFVSSTAITFSTGDSGPASLSVFSVTGRQVRILLDQAHVLPGSHRIIWDGRDESGHAVAAGLYFFRIQTTSWSATHKITKLR